MLGEWPPTWPLSTKVLVLQERSVWTAAQWESHMSSAPVFQRLQMCHIYGFKIVKYVFFIYRIFPSEGNIPERFKIYFEATFVNLQIFTLYPSWTGQFSISFRGTKLWNHVSHLAKSCSSIKCYKKSFNFCFVTAFPHVFYMSSLTTTINPGACGGSKHTHYSRKYNMKHTVTIS